MKSALGFCALLQIVFLPGFLLVRARRWSDGALQTLLLSFALSLLLNFLLVMLLVGLRLYTTPVLLGIFALELVALLWPPRGAAVPVSAGWQADVARLTQLGLDCWQGTWLQRVVRLGLVAFAAQAVVLSALEVTAHWGSIFFMWDEINSWNRWALDWAANHWPRLTMGYPQLVPANFSLTYVFMGTTHVWAFAKALTPLFPLATLLLWLDLALRTRRWGFLLAIPLTAILIKTILASLLLLGYADAPLMYLAAAGLYVCVLHHAVTPAPEQRRDSFSLLLPLLAAAAALTKITGWYVCFALLLLAWRWQAAQPTGPQPARWLARWLVVIALVAVPWYALAIGLLMPSQEGSLNAYDVLQYAHQGRAGMERVTHGLQWLVRNGGLPGILCLTMSLIALPHRRWRWLALLGGGWWLVWSLGMSYDARNLAPVLPLFALATAMGLEEACRMPARPRLALLLAALLLALAASNPVDRLALAQADELQHVGEKDVDFVLTQYLDEHEFDGKILSNYGFLPFVPHMAPYYQHEFFYDLAEFKRNLASTQACYLLLGAPWCEAAVREFIDQKIGTGEFKTLNAMGRWLFIRTDALRRVDRWKDVRALSHRLGSEAMDFDAQSLGIWQANKAAHEDFVFCGNYQKLPAGRYRIGCRVKAASIRPTHPLIFDVVTDSGRTCLGKVQLDHPTQGYEWISLEVSLQALTEIEFRCWKVGGGSAQFDVVHYQQL